MTLEKAIYIVEGQKNVSIHPWTRKGWFYYWDEEARKRHYTSKKRLIEAANWFVEDRLKNDNTTDPNIPILQISDIETVLFLIKAFPQAIRYKEDIIEYINI